MTPEERNLISGLFDRMRAQGSIQKDYEAESLINQQVRQNPDAAYMMVQSVLVGEQTLNAASERIQQLESRIRDLEAAAGKSQSSGGSFLGGLFGGGSRPAATSVPQTRSNAPAGGPWGQSAQPQYQQPQYQQPPMQQGYAQPAPRAGGGFMAQAMTTAAGVAGGMLAANAISNMMGGHHGGGAFGGASGNTGYSQSQMDAAQDAAQDQQMASDEDQQQDQQQDQNYAADDNDPGTSNASDDSWGGSDDSTDA